MLSVNQKNRDHNAKAKFLPVLKGLTGMLSRVIDEDTKVVICDYSSFILEDT